MTPLRVAGLALAVLALATACGDARSVQSANENACTACHGFPPPPFIRATTTSHPNNLQCSVCHADTVDDAGNLIAGGKHQNGTVDVRAHPVPYVAQHTAVALNDISSCVVCHGADYGGAAPSNDVSCNACHGSFGFSDWQTNCTFCHGQRTQGVTLTAASIPAAAPPPGARGETDPALPQVGAHAVHVGRGSTISDGVQRTVGGALTFACSECHALPPGTAPASLAHVDRTAPVAFGPLATLGGAAPAYAGGSCSATYCHGATLTGGAGTTPSWTGTVACGDCHGSPPSSGRHAIPQHVGQACFQCHNLVAALTNPPTIAAGATARGLHVNGAADVSFDVTITYDPATKTCSSVACHVPQDGDPRTWNP